MTAAETKRPDFDAFCKKYNPALNITSETYLFATFGVELEAIRSLDEKVVWTVIEAEGNLYLIPGKRYVDRFAYIIATTEWTDETEEYIYVEDVENADEN